MRRGSRAVTTLLRGLVGFEFWWEIDPADSRKAQTVQLPEPPGVRAIWDGLVPELIDYSKPEVHARAERVMHQVRLTHIPFSLSDLGGALNKVAEFRRVVGRRDGE